MSSDLVPRQLSAKVPVVDFGFHPTELVAALGLVNGKIKFYNYEKESERMQRVIRPLAKSSACRSICFTPKTGDNFIAGFESGEIVVGKTDTGQTTKIISSSTADSTPPAIYIVKPLNENLIFTGDDSGYVKLFDSRLSGQKPIVEFSNTFSDENGENIVSTDDWVSDIFIYHETGHKILVSRSDGTVCTYSTRRGGREVLRSESLGGELTAMAGPVKNGKKFIVSGSDGAINIFNWGEFGNISDRFPISRNGKLKSASGRYSVPISVDSICLLNDFLLFAGCGDGKIRLVSILPNAVLATVGTHEADYPVEHLHLTNDSSFVASSCYDGTVRFWSTAPYEKVNLAGNVCEEEEDEVDDDDSSDDESHRQPRLKKRRKEIKQKLSQRRNFFADLDKSPIGANEDEGSDDDDDDSNDDNDESENSDQSSD